MHSRNPYKDNQPDFDLLAKLYPITFGRHVFRDSKGRPMINFQDSAASRSLTETLLLHDFGIKATLREDRLCPAIPNRLNYLLWIQDLLDSTLRNMKKHQELSSSSTAPAFPPTSVEDDDPPKKKRRKLSREIPIPESIDPGLNIKGLDIGTGASAIYPLLGCALNSNWSFLGTDIDLESIKHSQQILDLNEAESIRLNTTPSTSNQVCSTQNRSTTTPSDRNLAFKSRIELLHRSESDQLIPIEIPSSNPPRECQRRGNPFLYHFTMCNPPFFESEEEVRKGREIKMLDPRGICLASNSELITPGGEVAFISRMIEESLQPELSERVLWFTSMIGKLSSLSEIVKKLKSNEIHNYAVTELIQGQTKRWAIAWSFKGWRIDDELSRPGISSLSSVVPSSNSIERIVKPSLLNESPVGNGSSGTDVDIKPSESLSSHVERFRKILQSIPESESYDLRSSVQQSQAMRDHDPSEGRILETAEAQKEISIRLAVYRDTWSRSARRKMAREAKERQVNEAQGDESSQANQSSEEEKSKEPFLIVDFNLSLPNKEEEEESGQEQSKSTKDAEEIRLKVRAEWIFGKVPDKLELKSSDNGGEVEGKENEKGKIVDLNQSWRGLVDHLMRWFEEGRE